MIDLHSGKELAERMGMQSATLVEHVRRGTITEPLGRVSRPGAREEFFWAKDDVPALSILGASAIVPAADWLGKREAESGYYLTPSRSSSHLGRYDGVSALGLSAQRRVTFYRVNRIIRIGYLDPIRHELMDLEGQWDLTLEEGDQVLEGSQLSREESSTLRQACMRRTQLSRDDAEGWMSNPGELTLYELAVDSPLAVDVHSEKIIRGVSFTLDAIDQDMTSVSTATLDEIAQTFLPGK